MISCKTFRFFLPALSTLFHATNDCMDVYYLFSGLKILHPFNHYCVLLANSVTSLFNPFTRSFYQTMYKWGTSQVPTYTHVYYFCSFPALWQIPTFFSILQLVVYPTDTICLSFVCPYQSSVIKFPECLLQVLLDSYPYSCLWHFITCLLDQISDLQHCFVSYQQNSSHAEFKCCLFRKNRTCQILV